MLIGTISAVNPTGFVRISPIDGGKALSAHRNRLCGIPFCSEIIGLRVRFDLSVHRKGNTAKNVEPIDRSAVPQVAEWPRKRAASSPPTIEQWEIDELLDAVQRHGQKRTIVKPSPEWLAEWGEKPLDVLHDGDGDVSQPPAEVDKAPTDGLPIFEFGGPQPGDPTPEEIQAACAEIRKTWSPIDYLHREGLLSDRRPADWKPPKQKTYTKSQARRDVRAIEYATEA